jgi:branched-chain amino acid transport system permease protein
MVSGLLIGALYGLFAVGLSLVFGVLRIVNFAHGDVVVVGMYLAYLAGTFLHTGTYLAIPVVAIALIPLGFATYLLLFHKARGGNSHDQLIITIGLSILIQNGALLTFSSTPRNLGGALGSGEVTRLFGNISVPSVDLYGAGASVLLTVALYVFLRRTQFGRSIRAVVADKRMAEWIGIRSGFVYMAAFTISVILAGVSGAVLVAQMPATPNLGTNLTLIAFICVVMGGTGDIVGAFFAALIVGLTETLSATYWSTSVQDVVPYLLFIVIVLVRPQGLFGRAIAVES